MRQLDSVERSFPAVGEDIEVAGRIDAHVANAAEFMLQQALLAEHAIVGEAELDHHLAGQRADPDFGGGGLGLHGEARRSDREWHPISHRQLGARLLAVHRNRSAGR